jgi:hypothetical protein
MTNDKWKIVVCQILTASLIVTSFLTVRAEGDEGNAESRYE